MHTSVFTFLATVLRQIALGVQHKVPFNSRPADAIGCAVGTTHVNSRVAAGERLLGEVTGTTIPVQTSEYEAELFYGCKPCPFVALRPNVQYVLHPGGSSVYASDVVIGLETTVTF
jgi:porin